MALNKRLLPVLLALAVCLGCLTGCTQHSDEAGAGDIVANAYSRAAASADDPSREESVEGEDPDESPGQAEDPEESPAAPEGGPLPVTGESSQTAKPSGEGNSLPVAGEASQDGGASSSPEASYYDLDSYSAADHSKYGAIGETSSGCGISSGDQSGRGSYETGSVPQGKPLPVEWQDTDTDTSTVWYCTLEIRCDTILNNMGSLLPGKEELVPTDGVIYSKTQVAFYKGESVFDVLLRECQSNRIHMEYSMTPMYNSNYIEGINNLYEFDCGELSGWVYSVDGWFPNYGCSRYQLADGEAILWTYTCDLGRDVGGDRNISQ